MGGLRTEIEEIRRRRRKLWLMKAALSISLILASSTFLVACLLLYLGKITFPPATLRGWFLLISSLIGMPAIIMSCWYGVRGLSKKASKLSTELWEKMGDVTKLWYLAPVLLGWLGGLVAYWDTRKRDEKLAWRLLIFGILVSITKYFISWLI